MLRTFTLVFLMMWIFFAKSQSNNPKSSNWIFNGTVNAMVKSGNTLFVGGTFRYAGPNLPHGVTLSASTGSLPSSISKPNGSVRAAIPDGSGGWYIGGDFTSVGGQSRNRLARINSDGSLHSWNPGAEGGQVSTLVLDNGIVYAGGQFTSVSGQTRNRIAAIDASSGALTSWNPNVSTDYGSVNAICIGGDLVYVGGDFSTIGGVTRQKLAAVEKSTGAVTAWNAYCNSLVYSIIKVNTTIYVGGYFTSIGGSSRNYIAALDSATATATTFNPGANQPINNMTKVDNTLYVTGFFATIGGQSRNRIAAIDLGTGNVTSWAPAVDNTIWSMHAIGSNVYIGGAFTSAGGQSRRYLAAIDASTGLATSWGQDGTSDAVYVVQSDGTNVYVGGSFKSISGVVRNRLAAIDLTTGVCNSWNPDIDGNINALLLDGSTLYIGGTFTNVNGTTPRNRIAALDVSTGLATSFNPNASGTVNTLAKDGTTLYAGGQFTTVNGGTTRNRLAAFDLSTGTATAWNPNVSSTVRAILINSGILYAGGQFTTVNGSATRNRLAAFNLSDGVVTTWDPNASGTVQTMALSNTELFIGGAFTTLNGSTSRNMVASVDIGTGTVTSWNPNASHSLYTASVSCIRVLSNSVYVTGEFTTIGGQSRNGLASLSTSTGNADTWNPNLGIAAGIGNEIVPTSSSIFVGGGLTEIGSMPQSYFAEFEIPCNNPTSGGTIAAAQSGSSPFDPAAFTSSVAAAGHDGTLEYKWQSSTTSSIAGFSDIALSNTATYDPGSLTQTTWFKRLARVDCKSNWTGAAESNVLEVTIASMAAEPTGQPTNLYFTTTGSSPYNFVANFTPSGSATGYLVIRNTGSVPTFTPVDGTGYSPGSQTGGEIVYSGSLTTFTDNSVTVNTSYHYTIFAYNGTGSTTNYLTSSPLTGKSVVNTTSSGSLTASATGSSIGFPTSGVTVNFPSGTSGTNLTVSKTTSAPASNIQVSSSIRGMKPMYFSITSSSTSPGNYTLILDFSALSLTPTQWNSYKITKRADANSPWVDVTTLGATIVNRQTDGIWGKFTITGLSSFSEFGLAEAYDGILTTNLDQTPVSASTVDVDLSNFAGQAFVTDGIRYNLSKVKVSVASNGNNLRAKLYGSTSGEVNTSALITTLGTPSQVGTSRVYEIAPSTTIKLEPNTQYWVVFYSSTGTVGIDYTTSATETGPASYPNNYSVSSNDGGTSFNPANTDDPALFSIEATEVTRTWTGGSSTVWSTSGNWSPSETPGNGEIMTIPNLSNDPVLDGNIAPANLIIASGTVLNMADKNITLTQGFSNDGSLTSTTGKLIMAGTSAQGIVGTGSISRLEVNNSAGAVISAGSHMQTITGMLTPTSGTLSTNGNLTLKSDATGTARVGAGSASGGYITGDVITQRHLTKLTGTGRNGRAWRLVSVPVEGTGTLRDYFMAGRSGTDLTVSANRSSEPGDLGTVVIGHNYANATDANNAGFDWIGVPNQVSSLRYYTQGSGSGSFASSQVPSMSTTYNAAAQGYMLFSRGDRQQQYNGTGNSSTTKLQATGTLKQGTKTVTIPALASAGYVLVGNPYMAVIDMDLVYNDNSSIIDPVFYIWDANTDGNSFKQGGYRTITRTGPGVWTTTGGGTNPQYIESHAAFFVRPTAAGGTLQIKESHKVTGTPGIAPHGTDGNNPARLFVNLEITDTANRRLVDGAVVFFDAQYKEGLGDAVDIASMSNITAGAVGLKQSGLRLAMEGRPWPGDSLQRSIPVDMRNLGDDPYVLRLIGESLTKDGFRAWLKDRHLKTETEVKVDGELLYPFRRTGDAGIDSGRFEIVYRTTPKFTGGTVTPDDASETPSVRLFPNPSKTSDVNLSLRAMVPGSYTVQVLDMLGREVATGSLEHKSINGEYRVLKGTRLSPGQYIIRLIDADKQPKETLRMVVE